MCAGLMIGAAMPERWPRSSLAPEQRLSRVAMAGMVLVRYDAHH
jgi:hypothetical protein